MQAQPWQRVTHPSPSPLNRDSGYVSSSGSISISVRGSQVSLFGKPVNSSTYASVLESCRCPDAGKEIHAHILKTGFGRNEFLETKLLQLYGRFGCFEDAHLLFETMPTRNLYSWVALLSLYVDEELFDEAVRLFLHILQEDLMLDFFVFPLGFKICSGLKDLKLGKQLHGFVVKHEFVSNVYVGNALIDMYGKCGSLEDAKRHFGKMPERDRVSWNSVVNACSVNGMIYESLEFMDQMSCLDESMRPNLVSWSAVVGGFAQSGHDREAIDLLFEMQGKGLEPNARTLASVLPSCARLQNLDMGKMFHGFITGHGFMSSPFVVNGLIDMYRRCGEMESAFKLFSIFAVKNSVSCNTMIVGFCENGDISRAWNLFNEMELFGVEKDTISWNSMIAGLIENFLLEEALSMFKDMLMEEMIEPDSFTLGSVLTACVDTASLRLGREIHSYAISRGLASNTYVGGALVEMYCKSGGLDSARKAFDEVTERDIAIWNALISGYARCNQIEDARDLLLELKESGLQPNAYTWNGLIAGHLENKHDETAMRLFREMQSCNLRPDVYAVGMILVACSKLASIRRGKQVHAYSIRLGYESDIYIGAALVDMYAKCGSLNHTRLVYKMILNPNLVLHNALLTGYAMHGLGEEGIAHFRFMLANGVRPDHVTFLSVLSACVHAGSIEAGREFFSLMGLYDVKPSLKHYTCMVDLLSRAGELDEAYELMKSVPMEADSVMWGALLGGCLVHRNVELGQMAGEKLIELEPDNTGNHIMLANLYAHAGRWEELAETRRRMKETGLQKSPGCSWIEDGGHVHVLLAHDRSHERAEELYCILDSLNLQMKLHSEIIL
ncbi:PREDICTED: pentatricopeptide repeat-containing protein At2g13600-like [Tarenaya hassleriana]|uniref:pentatricopeptide repeat-containing protein At2g13600-like n=1 Tax=Tarenaya hassleriana TaxID=28532 RepID=UPI00053C723D|nr:PREDICTED: pentatricopeptide repeat-containing protein At2g13600-like [Tarenaya hassleriana]